MKKAALSILVSTLIVSATASAHLVGGSGFSSGVAQPQVMYRSSFDLVGKETTTIVVTGDGTGDMDCYLYEGDFKTHDASLIGRDVTKRDGCSFEVFPRKTKRFSMLVQNASDHPERYTIVID